MSINPPILFGVDPDEIWHFVPKAARDAKLDKPPIFHLRAPSLAATIKREELISERRAAALALDPTVLDEIGEVTGGRFELAPLPEGANDEDAKAYIEKAKAYLALNERWIKAWKAVGPAFQEREEESDIRILSESVATWENLPTASGRLIEFASVKDRLGFVLRGSLREEVIVAAVAGTFVTKGDAEGLQSSPASQAA